MRTASHLKKSYVDLGGEPPLLGCTLDDALREVASLYPENDAVVAIPQKRRLTYASFDQSIDQLARALLALGLEKGDRVGIWSTNNVEWVLLQMATARIGAILVNINPSYRVEELEYGLRLAKVQALFLIPSFRSSHYVEMVRKLCPETDAQAPGELTCEKLPDLRWLVVYDPSNPDRTEPPARGFLTWPELLERGAAIKTELVRERAASLDTDDPINIQFTSGTTGHAKAVLLTHHGIINNAYFIGEIMKLTEKDRVCVPVPFYHCFGMVVSNLGCFLHGAAVVIPAEHFDPVATLEAIEKEGCTAVNGVPTMFIAELEVLEKEKRDLSSLRTGIMAGAPCPPPIMRRVMEEMGCREILIGYGQTEASPVTHLTRPDDEFTRRIETVGTNLPHQEVKVVDAETGAVVPVGQSGEVCFRGYHVMRGYFGQEDATRAAIDEQGWLHSGDLGVLDEDGYLRITGRLKDMIIRGGENIYPAEIESLFYKHSKVAAVAVFGIPDPRLGEEVGAWIKLHEGEEAEVDELKAYAREHLAHFKVPRHIWLVDEFPMTVTGKIQKFRIREIVGEWMKSESLPRMPR